MDDMARLRVLIADDDGRVRRALRALLKAEPDFAVVGEVATAREVCAATRALRPAVVVLDLLQPAAEDGLGLVRRLAGEPGRGRRVRAGTARARCPP